MLHIVCTSFLRSGTIFHPGYSVEMKVQECLGSETGLLEKSASTKKVWKFVSSSYTARGRSVFLLNWLLKSTYFHICTFGLYGNYWQFLYTRIIMSFSIEILLSSEVWFIIVLYKNILDTLAWLLPPCITNHGGCTKSLLPSMQKIPQIHLSMYPIWRQTVTGEIP